MAYRRARRNADSSSLERGLAAARRAPRSDRLELFCGYGAMADVAAKLHAVEMDAFGRLIGAALRHLYAVAQGRYAQHPPAADQHLVAVQGRAGVENHAILGAFRVPGESGDDRACLRRVRIVGGSEHHAQGGAPVPTKSCALTAPHARGSVAR